MARVVDPRSDRPVYKQIADRLRDDIGFGQYQPGDLLPSEHELAAEYGVARGTARQAIQVLREEGLIDAVHGLGCFVRTPEPVERLRLGAPSAGWEMVREPGNDGRGSVFEAGAMLYATTELGRDRPPAEVAELLGLGPDETVLVRSWEAIEQSDANGRGGGVRTLATAYTRFEVAKRAGLHGQSGPTVYLLFSAAGYQITRITEEVGARMPTNAEAGRLDLDRGVPVLSIRRVNYTATDPQPVEVTETVMSAERYRMVYDLGGD